MKRGLFKIPLGLAALILVLVSAAPVFADIQTTLSFASPSTIFAGTSTTVDFGVNFTPIPAGVTSTQYLDVATNSPVSSCAVDLSTCEEIQTITLTSTLSSLSATLVAPGAAPSSDAVTAAGNYQVALAYATPGTFKISTQGSDLENVDQQSCVTIFANGVATGPTTCAAAGQSKVSGTFDKTGTPVLTAIVNSVKTIPEPSSLGLLGIGACTALAFLYRSRGHNLIASK